MSFAVKEPELVANMLGPTAQAMSELKKMVGYLDVQDLLFGHEVSASSRRREFGALGLSASDWSGNKIVHKVDIKGRSQLEQRAGRRELSVVSGRFPCHDGLGSRCHLRWSSARVCIVDLSTKVSHVNLSHIPRA